MTMEQRMDQLEKRNKRLTVGLTMMAVVVCAVVTMAATGDKNGDFNTVTARKIVAKNHAGDIVAALGADPDGAGYLMTISDLGTPLVTLASTVNGNGTVTTSRPNGKDLVDLTSGENGGMIVVHNKTGEEIVQMGADEYGNGVVGAYNRKGMGQVLQPGP